jgi:hypothetical protein
MTTESDQDLLSTIANNQDVFSEIAAYLAENSELATQLNLRRNVTFLAPLDLSLLTSDPLQYSTSYYTIDGTFDFGENQYNGKTLLLGTEVGGAEGAILIRNTASPTVYQLGDITVRGGLNKTAIVSGAVSGNPAALPSGLTVRRVIDITTAYYLVYLRISHVLSR